MSSFLRYILVIFLASLAVSAGLLLSSYMGEMTPEEASVEYKSDTYGYSVFYPSHLKVEKYSQDIISFAAITNDSIESVAEIRMMTIEGMPEESFENAVVRSLSTLCAADGPMGSFSCTGLETSELFDTDAGGRGVKLYLSGEFLDLTTGLTTTVSKGPYYVFLLEANATMSRILVIEPPRTKDPSEVDADTIEAIAKSLVLPPKEERTSGIEEYVRKNIGVLSSKKPILGGMFYVTNIEAAGGTGVVEYEDGHIALTADFT